MTNISTTTAVKFVINTPKYYNKFRYIQSILVRITLPYIFIITCIGFITNTLTIMLLSKNSVTKSLRHKWALIALALSDLFLNTALFIRVIHDIIGGKLAYLCIIISFLSHLAELLSAYFIVLFTVQRFAAVRFPLKAAFQKRSSPFISLLLIFISSLIFCIILTHSNTYINCHEELKLHWFIADALTSFIIPFALILIFNILIINTIRKHARLPITVQSTLLRPYKYVKNGIPYKKNKNNHHRKSCSITYSNGNTYTSPGTISETSFDRKLPSSYSLSKIAENHISTNSNEPFLSGPISNEISIPTSSLEKKLSDELSEQYSLSPTSDELIKLPHENQTNNQRTSNDLSQLRRSSRISNDIDYMPKKDTQTTQSIRVTRMLILVSTCFLILNAPAHVCVIALKIYTSIDSPIYNEHTELDHFKTTKNFTDNQLTNLVFIQTNNNLMNESKHLLSDEIETIDDQILIHILYIAVLFTQLISYASYSINFFLYSLSGIAFRTSLRRCCRK